MDIIPEDAMPGQRHPLYEGANAKALLRAARKHGAVVLPDLPTSQIDTWRNDPTVAEAGFLTNTLTLHRVAAPAPYVGTRQWYTWWVLRDEAGRCIADDDVRRAVNLTRAFIEGWQGSDDELDSLRCPPLTLPPSSVRPAP